MEETMKDATRVLAAKITADMKSEDALRITQAMLNLAHVLAVHTNIGK